MTRAELIEEVSPWTHRTRRRCTLCNKVAYDTRTDAEIAAQTIRADAANDPRRVEARSMDVYYKAECGWWHLFRNIIGPKKPRRGRWRSD